LRINVAKAAERMGQMENDGTEKRGKIGCGFLPFT